MSANGRGRPAIARGDVHLRAWWDDIVISAPDGDSMNGRSVERNPEITGEHWFWTRPTPLIYGVWKASGEKPERVLFYELRPEDWDNKPSYARLVSGCGIVACINPWHRDVYDTVRSGSLTPVERARNAPRPVEMSTWDRATVCSGYIHALESMKSGKMLDQIIVVAPDGRLQIGTNRKAYLESFIAADWTPAILVAIEDMLNRDDAPTLGEAKLQMEALNDAVRAEMAEWESVGRARITALLGPPATHRVKPKPRRRA